jgi:hypothetical protein
VSHETKDHSPYRNDGQDTRAETTLGLASQRSQFGQKKFSQGKGDGNPKSMRDEIKRYRVTPRATEGAAKETIIPESMGDGEYELRYCPFLQRNVFVQETDADELGLHQYILGVSNPSAAVGAHEWKDISTSFTLEATNCQMFMIFWAKADRFRDARNIDEKKTESDSAKKAQKPERASAVAVMMEKTDESKSILPAQKNKSAVAAYQASEPAQDEKIYKRAVAASTQASEPAQDDKKYKSAVAASTQASEPAQDDKIYKHVYAQPTFSTIDMHTPAALLLGIKCLGCMP